MSNELIESKFPTLGLSIFTEMSGLAIATNAINLSQGFPEFETPPFLKNAVNEAINSNKNQYSPSPGSPELLAEIGKLITR